MPRPALSKRTIRSIDDGLDASRHLETLLPVVQRIAAGSNPGMFEINHLNATVAISLLVEEDIKEIADYTRNKWGDGQVYAYLNKLIELVSRLAMWPESAFSVPEMKKDGIFQAVWESHNVFYKVEPSGVYLVRILQP